LALNARVGLISLIIVEDMPSFTITAFGIIERFGRINLILIYDAFILLKILSNIWVRTIILKLNSLRIWNLRFSDALLAKRFLQIIFLAYSLLSTSFLRSHLSESIQLFTSLRTFLAFVS
jgi:hypothetical protein